MTAEAPPTKRRPRALERLGLAVVRRPAPEGAPALDAVHILNKDERRKILRVERVGIAAAALAGCLSAVATGLADHGLAGWEDDPVAYWSLIAAVNLVIASIEIAFLYANSLHAVRGLALAAGLPMEGDEGDEVALSLTRAALELPSPLEPELGVDPFSEANRAQIVAASLAYKAKTAASNFVAKAVLRRALGRAASRVVLSAAALPVNAGWNAWVAAKVAHEARVRVMGASAIEEMLRVVFFDAPRLSENGRLAVHQAAAAVVVRTRVLHPNLVHLLRQLRARVGDPPPGVRVDDTRRFLANLAGLPEEERHVVLRVVTIAAVLDGRFGRRERQLVREARVCAGFDADLSAPERLLRDFLSGDPIAPGDVRATG